MLSFWADKTLLIAVKFRFARWGDWLVRKLKVEGSFQFSVASRTCEVIPQVCVGDVVVVVDSSYQMRYVVAPHEAKANHATHKTSALKALQNARYRRLASDRKLHKLRKILHFHCAELAIFVQFRRVARLVAEMMLLQQSFLSQLQHFMNVKVRRGNPLPLPLSISWQRGKIIPSTPILFDVEGERVTIWKNILSLFWRVGVNHFEGAGWLRMLADGWDWVEQVC